MFIIFRSFPCIIIYLRTLFPCTRTGSVFFWAYYTWVIPMHTSLSDTRRTCGDSVQYNFRLTGKKKDSVQYNQNFELCMSSCSRSSLVSRSARGWLHGFDFVCASFDFAFSAIRFECNVAILYDMLFYTTV